VSARFRPFFFFQTDRKFHISCNLEHVVLFPTRETAQQLMITAFWGSTFHALNI
jgi:hypothetical protein